MNKRTFFSITILGSTFVVLLLYCSLTTGKDNYNTFLNPKETFAQEVNQPLPVIKNSKIINFSGINYADVVNSRDISLNSFTVSTWFNTIMNVTGRDVAFLINKGGFGTDRPGFNLNYGLWLNNREQVSGGFETSTGEDFFLTSQGSYADRLWHNAILTFDNEQHFLKLFMDGLELGNNSTNIGTTPDTTGKQPVRLGANSLEDKGVLNGNYTGQLDDIQVWNYAFTNEQVASLFDVESKMRR